MARKFVIFSIAVVVAGFAHPEAGFAFARRWHTVDLFKGTQQNAPAVIAGMATAGRAVFSVGLEGNPRTSGELWLVRRSLNEGRTWSIAEEGIPGLPGGSAARGIATHDGTIYVAGRAGSGGTQHWVVQKSTDLGAHWSLIDDQTSIDSLAHVEARSVGVDQNGVVYVSGFGVGSGQTHWLVRRSADGGASWATVDDFGVGSSGFTEPHATAAGFGSDVFVGGATASGWLVRHSADGLAWSTVDNFHLTGPGDGSTSFGGAMDPRTGDVIFVGTVDVTVGPDTSTHWITRASSVAKPGQWTIVDDYAPFIGNTGFAAPLDATFAPNGSVYVNGTVITQDPWPNGPPEIEFGAIRRAAALGRPFRTDWVSDPVKASGFFVESTAGAASGPDGDVFVGGSSVLRRRSNARTADGP